MMKGLVLLAASCSAFLMPMHQPAQQLKASPMLDGMEGATKPFGLWDPLNLAEYGTETTVAWYRAAEIKHGRVAMAATVGWILNEMGVTFPGDVATGVPFKSLGKGVDAWVALPDYGKAQIIAFIGILELGGESISPHYLKGGKLGSVPGPFGYGKLWDPASFVYKVNDETKLEAARNKELNNGTPLFPLSFHSLSLGRLAMISAIGFFAASYIPGSVPGVPSNW